MWLIWWSIYLAANAVSAAVYAPNAFLGTCLTEEWVRRMEVELGVSASHRDPATGQLLHPFLRAALPSPRYSLVDNRTASPNVYSPTCFPSTDTVYGPDAVVDPETGIVKSIGYVNGSIVLGMNEGGVHRLKTMIASIVLRELVGFNITIYYTPGVVDISKRFPMSVACTPVNANIAASSRVAFSNSSSWKSVGDVANRNIQGIYTTKTFVADGQDPTKFSTTFDADFWRGYVSNEDLISELAFSNLNDSQYLPPTTTYCNDGEYGCFHHCQRMYACTLREQEGKECLVIVATQPKSTNYNWPALISNLNIPAYMCYIGRNALQSFVLEKYEQGKGVLFYLNYPDELTSRYPGVFTRVSMPKGTAKEIAMSTTAFGENGYGQPTNNPMHVDQLDDVNQKIMSMNFFTEQANTPATNVFSRIRIPDADFENILSRYITITNDSTSSNIADPYFESACGWMRENYDMWKDWMVALPLCTIQDHMNRLMSGCTNGSSTTREVVFEWKVADPTNASRPYVCDGGVMELPSIFRSSRSCEWLSENLDTWVDWIAAKPPCDSSFYTYHVSECGADSMCEIKFSWLLPDLDDKSSSLECSGSLPATVRIHCDYMPVMSTNYLVVAVLVWILLGIIIVSMVLVAKYREVAIVRRSQFEFLELMLIGAAFVCIAILIYAGEPTDAVCASRPVMLSLGFTLVFGSLVVKTLRVYRIFNTKKLKRVVLPTRTMLKYMGGFVLVDVVVLATWFIVDFPSKTTTVDVVEQVSSAVVVHTSVCSSSGFLFSAMLLFYKAILLTSGLYLSFQVRNLSSDFQEAVWIFGSSVVVAVASVMLLPLAYLVPLDASVFYMFFAGVLWVATAAVVGLMLLPKFLRHRDQSSLTSSTSSSFPASGSDSALKASDPLKCGSRVAVGNDDNITSADTALANCHQDRYHANPEHAKSLRHL